PSQKIRSARVARKQKITTENGSLFSCSFTRAASPSIPLRKSTGFVPLEPGSGQAESACRHSCVRAPNRAQNCSDVSRIGAAWHPYLDGSNYDLDNGRATLIRGLVRLCRIQHARADRRAPVETLRHGGGRYILRSCGESMT